MFFIGQRKQGVPTHRIKASKEARDLRVSICVAAENMWKLAQTHLHDEHALQHGRRKEELNIPFIINT